MPSHSLLKQVNIKSMGARLISRNVRPMVFPNFFRTVGTDSLKWETLTGRKRVPVMAEVISYDASFPEKRRDKVTKASGDIPKIAISRSMNESDYNKYINLSRYVNGRSDLKQLLDLVFEDLDFCYNGVRARMEYLAMAILSNGQLSLATTNSNNIITETALDFGVPAENKFGYNTTGIGSGYPWSNANATPLVDLSKMAQKALNDDGVTGSYFIMTTPTFNYLRNATDTTTRIKNYINQTGKFNVTKDAINSYLISEGLPTIVVINPKLTNEDLEHTQSIVSPFSTAHVVMIPDAVIGSIQAGPIAAERSAELRKIATMVKKDWILTMKWSELNPFKEHTSAEANAFPVLDDPETLFYLDTESASFGV